MQKKVRNYIIENQMLAPGTVALAGVSGGGDSMAMLSLLRELRHELDFELCAVHVHHGIRGAEADRDRALVEKTCREWEIPCRTFVYDVPALSKEWKTGCEETGRLVRRQAFAEEKSRYEAMGKTVRTALAHNQEDLAETMLHNLARGTGLRGLSTMRPAEGEIIRPLLCLSRAEIAHYLKEKEIPHITDSSNLSDEYTRNRIRHHILPLLESEVNSRAAAHMAETAGRLALAEDYLGKKGRELLGSCPAENGAYLLTEEFFREEEIVRIYALLEALEMLAGRRKDFTAVHLRQIQELRERETGRQISLPYGLSAEKTYEGVRLGKKRTQMPRTEEAGVKLAVPGRTESALGTVEAEIFLYKGQKIEEKTCTKWLDYDKIKGDLYIRTRRAGDYLIVNRAGGSKKLNRCMIDGKIPREQREKIPLIACGDEVLWMVGHRISEKYKIDSGTGKVLELKYQGGYVNG